MKRNREELKAKTSVRRPNPAIDLSRRHAEIPSPSTGTENRRNSENKFRCPLCLSAISKVVESSCCNTLFCRGCAESAFLSQRYCPHCRRGPFGRGQGALPLSWTHSRWIQREIDAIAPKCNLCDVNIFPCDRDGHYRVCQARNATCFKCLGKGALEFLRGGGNSSDEDETITVTCDACGGNQLLIGLEWTRCSKCNGRGEIFNAHKDDLLCSSCKGRGALKGLDWTKCFKCIGTGEAFRDGNHVPCDACATRGMLRGLRWTACFKCERGIYVASNGNRLPCAACEGKAVLKGLEWTKCYNCHGRGAYASENGAHFSCHACSGKGAFEGSDWSKCSMCNGKGTKVVKNGYYHIPCDACAAKGALKGTANET